MAQTLAPPYRATGYSYTYRTSVLQVSQGISLYPPNLPYRSQRGGDGRGYRSSSCPLSEGPKGGRRKGGPGVANCRIFRSAVPSVVVWSILLVSLSGVKKKL